MSYANDPVFQIIEKIRTPGALEETVALTWNQWYGRKPQVVSVQPGLIHYKPYTRARVTTEAVVAEEDAAPRRKKINLLFTIYPELAQARRKVDRFHLRQRAAKPILIPQWQSVLWPLPHAPRLRKLKKVMKPKKFRRLLGLPALTKPGLAKGPKPQLIRYVPRKRAVIAWEDPETRVRYYGKMLIKTEAVRVVKNFQEIQAASSRHELGFAVPRIIGYHAKYRTLLMTEVPGRPFTDDMRRARRERFAQVAQGLARLHHSTVRPGTVWYPGREFEALVRHMRSFKLVLPRLSGAVDGVVTRLQELLGGLACRLNLPIHGNLFGDQILTERQGIGIVDWDTLAWGDPHYDLGRLLAHLVYLAGIEGIPPAAIDGCAHEMLSAYEMEAGKRIDPQCLTWHASAQLLMRGKISSLRQLPQDWPEHLAFVAAESGRLLDGNSPFLNLS